MLKVLMTSNYNSPNIFVKECVDGLRNLVNVTCDIDSFWDSNIYFDIIHIQWIEELFHWNKVSKSDIGQLEKRLIYWKEKGSKIVITRHNKIPHRMHELDELLYETAFKLCDSVIHLGHYSLKELRITKKDVIIPHVNYVSIVKKIAIEDAKTFINISKNSNLFFCFGVIRNVKEELQIIKGFNKMKSKNDVLLIAGTKLLGKKVSFKKKPVKRLIFEIKTFSYKRKNIFFHKNRIPNNELKYFFNAASIVISPRINTLNSGVLYTGFSFSKVVVGPNCGNIGEILRSLKNPIYKPEDTLSISLALSQAKEALSSDLGELNFKYVEKECQPKVVAEKHFSLYKSLQK